MAKREVRRRQRLSWDKFATNLEHKTCRTQPEVYKILKQISKNVNETASIQGSIDEKIFLQYYEKLWNTTNINELTLEYNLADYSHDFLTLDELEKVLKLTKIVTPQDKITLTQSYTSVHQESLNLRLLQFLNNVYRENHIPNEWRNAV